ncbi:MAG: DbpA RNA binding domain-containing protein, partial [Chromatiales bacterium]|nr:DbpA RNA binding domain-containing protein [Chromatiales bacterium]
KTATVEIADKLEARGYAVAALNGDLTQPVRERVIDQLKQGRLDIIVATDVAARGLDVARITHVINYDVPYDTEAYVHRIGRTGRAGRTGTAILFVTPREMRMLGLIERATRQKIEPLPLPSRAAVADRRVAQFREQIENVIATEELDFFREVVRDLEASGTADMQEVAAALAYLAQRERPLQLPPSQGPDIANAHRSMRPASTRISAEGVNPGGALVRYRIEVGRHHQASPKDIVGAIANETGISGRNIGRIDLFEDHSTVELPTDLPPEILETLRRTRVRQRPLGIRTLTGEEAEVSARPGPRPKHSPSGKYAKGGKAKPGKPRKPKRT